MEIVTAPHCQVSDLLPIGYLIVVGDQAYHRCVVSKLNDGIGVVLGHAVMNMTACHEQRTKQEPACTPEGPPG